MAPQKQIDDLEILLNEAGISSLAHRRDYILKRYPPKKHLEDLTIKEASELIERLKES